MDGHIASLVPWSTGLRRMDVRPAMFGFCVYTFCSTALAVMATHQDGRLEGRVHICVQYVILGDWVALPLYAKIRSNSCWS
jgi:hypothetical protein